MPLDNELIAAIIGGLIATFGPVVTLITSYLYRNVGRIIINLNSSTIQQLVTDEGGFVGVTFFLKIPEA